MFLEQIPLWFYAMLFLIIIIILAIFLFFSKKSIHVIKQSESEIWSNDNIFIFVILGDCANFNQKYGSKNVRKYINYSLVSDAVLIKRLATRHLKLNPKNIVIFAHGEKTDFDIKSITKKISIQISLKEIYKTEPDPDDFNFYYYQKTDMIQGIITSKLEGHPDAHIILFLDDHGGPLHFADSPFFDYYLFFMKIEHASLHIFNDSCYSGKIIDLLENYFKISDALKISNEKITTIDLQFISFILKELQPKKRIGDLKYIFLLIQKFSQYENKQKQLIKIFKSICDILESNYKNQSTINYDIKLKDISFSDSANDEFIKNHITLLTKIGICTLGDLFDFYKFIFYFENYYGDQDEFGLIHTKINSIIKPARIVQNAFKCNNEELFTIVKELSVQNKFFADNLYERHPNHYLITSSHKKGLAPTFGTRRVGSNIKAVLGSPAMSTFIIEALIFPNQKGVNIDKIKSIASETKTYYKEYAVQIFFGFKKWLRLFFTEWKSSKHANENFIKFDSVNMTLEDVMKSIGFELAARFSDDDLETLINLDPAKQEVGEQNLEEFGFIIQPRNKRNKRKRYRTINKDTKTSFNGITVIEQEKDSYYSDDEHDYNERNQSNIKSSNLILATINADERIDINEINYFQKNIYTKRIDFVPDLIFVLRYELQELTKDLDYPFKIDDQFNIDDSHNIMYNKLDQPFPFTLEYKIRFK